MTDEQRASLRVLTSMAAGIATGQASDFAQWGNERRAQVAFATQLLILDALERIAGPVVESSKPEAEQVPKKGRKANG